MSARTTRSRKAKRRSKSPDGYANPALQGQWDAAAALIDEANKLLTEIPRSTLGHPASIAQFTDLIPDLKAAVSGLRAIRRWELERYNKIPEPVREALSSPEACS